MSIVVRRREAERAILARPIASSLPQARCCARSSCRSARQGSRAATVCRPRRKTDKTPGKAQSALVRLGPAARATAAPDPREEEVGHGLGCVARSLPLGAARPPARPLTACRSRPTLAVVRTDSEVMSALAPHVAASRAVRAADAVVAPVPPLAIATVPLTLAAVPVMLLSRKARVLRTACRPTRPLRRSWCRDWRPRRASAARRCWSRPGSGCC